MKYLGKIHDFKIKTKLIIIYIFCVCFPLIVTNGVIISSVKESTLKRQDMMMANLMERIEYNVTAHIGECLSIANKLYTDTVIDEFLIKDYTSNLDYFHHYKNLIQNNILGYYYKSTDITQIMLMVDNPSLINGGSFWKIEDVKDKQWYKVFNASNQEMLLLPYYDEEKKYLSGTCRTISIIKRLNYFGMQEIERLIKIDLKYSTILNELFNEQLDGEIYICNDQYVLFSNKLEENSRKSFQSITSLNRTAMPYEHSFLAGTDTWTIYVNPAKISIWTMLDDLKDMIPLLILINLLIPTIIISLVAKSFTGRIKMIETYLDKVKREEFEEIKENGGEDELGSLIKSYNLMVMKIKELIEVVFRKNAEKQTLELARKEAELKALQSQVNPHFMFNTLESIRMRSLIKKETETAEVISALSVLLRKSFSWDSDYIDLEEEIMFVKKYASIQQYRFGDKLSFGVYIMPGCEQIKIPKLSILTFVENACIHGIEATSERGEIFVAISKDEKTLFIEISDSGHGMQQEELEEIRERYAHMSINILSEVKSTGLLNALLRMNLYCSGELKFEIESEVGQGTDILIQMPLEKVIMGG